MIYTLPDLIDRSASARPDGVAVSCREESITYEGLVAGSNSLARTLGELGVGLGDRIGIYLNKSIESVVALYGIMKSGAVYVPLDPTSPPERLAFVIQDCDIRHVISSDRKAKGLADLEALGVELQTVIGTSGHDLPYQSVSWGDLVSDTTRPVSPVTEQDLSYVLYTSGSTGVPKGIMHTHRSALAWAEVTAKTYQIGSNDVISNYAPLHFDLSTLDIFGGAKGGATVVMIPEEHMKMPMSLGALIEKERLTQFYTVPLALIQLGGPGVVDGRDLSSLKRILFGGEPMPIKHLRTLMDKLPDCRFFNVYGPTETNGCTHYEVPRPITEDVESLPIGGVYDNVEVMVVDGDDRLVTRGEVGELLVRAPTLMKGYWGRPDLNEHAFYFRNLHAGLPDVFHRTGDLAHEGPDGVLQFHGRKDRQVKSRGYRVELDEVEAVLVSHPAVEEGAVFAVSVEDGVSIAAAVIPKSDELVDVANLMTFLGAKLPPYALPVSVAIETDFPRTTSGKIDRKELATEFAHSNSTGET